MSKNLNPSCKQCRRIGEKLMLKGERCSAPKCAMVKRNYPPGVHGNKAKKRLTTYGEQLQEKQKAKEIYGILEKQFKNTFVKAGKMKGDVGENFLRMLEMRLDSFVYNLGFAESRRKARLLINHGHFNVNKRKVSIPSFIVSEGDILKIRENKTRKKAFSELKEKIKNHEMPGWIYFDKDEMSGKVLHEPSLKDIKNNINISMIVEFYSK